MRASIASDRATSRPVSSRAGASHSPNGTRRMAPRQPTAATDGRMSASIGTPADWLGRGDLVGEHLERPEEHRDEQQDRDDPDRRRLRQPRQAHDGHRQEREVATARPVLHRGDGTRAGHVRPGFPPAQASSASRSRVFTTSPGRTHARRAWLTPQRTYVELGGLVGVRIDRQHAAVGDRAPGPLDGEVEPMGGAVDLERRAGPRGRRVDLVPLEVEVVAAAEHPAGRVRDDVDVRAADRVERPPRQVRARLAPRDVERGHDEVERREQVVLEVERAVGADLELAAVEQPEPARRRLRWRGPGRLLRREPGVEPRDDLALLRHLVGREPAGDRERLGVVGQDLVGVAAPPGGLGHDLDRVDAVGPVRVAVQVAAQVGDVDEGRQRARERRLDLAAVLAQLRLDERQAEEGVRLGLGRERPELGGVAGQRLPVLADPQEPLLRERPALVAGHRAQADVVLLRPGEVDAVRAGLAGRHDHQVHLRAAQQADRGLVPAGVHDVVDGAERREAPDERGGVVGLGEEVEVADRLAPAAERARRLDAAHAGRVREELDETQDELLRPVEQHPVGRGVEPLDPLEDERLGLRRHPAQVAQPAGLGGLPEVLHRLDLRARGGAGGRSWARGPGSGAGRRARAGSRRAAGRRRPCGRSWRAPRSCR